MGRNRVDLLRKPPGGAGRTKRLRKKRARWEALRDEFVRRLVAPLRLGVLRGEVLRAVYQPQPLEPGARVEYPLDLLQEPSCPSPT